MNRELIEALLQLERCAARVGHLLPAEMDPEQQLELVSAFGAHPLKGHRRDRWATYWLAWCRDCAQRLPAEAETPANRADWTG